jgi:hypothetical protein
MAERAEAKRPPNKTSEADDLLVPADGFGFDHGRQIELRDDATTPLAAEAEYGWPWPRTDDAEQAEEDPAPPVTHARS